MPKKPGEQFSNLKVPEVPAGLFERILGEIHREKRLVAIQRRLTILTVAALMLLAALFFVLKVLWSGLAESGLFRIGLLIFSDPDALMASPNDVLFLVLESLPVASLLAFLSTIFIFLGSLKFIIKGLDAVRLARVSN